MNISKNIYLVLFLLVAGSFASLAAADYGGYAGSFLQISVHPRATGMGNAFIAVSDDASGVFFNPGAVAQITNYSFSAAYRILSHDRQLQQLALMFPIRNEAIIGISAEVASMSNIVGRDRSGRPTGELDNLDAVLGITFSRRFSRFLFIGGNVRYYHKKLESVTAYSAGFDVGALVRLKRNDILPAIGILDLIRFGVVARNIAAKYPWNTGKYWKETEGVLGTDVTEDVPLVVKVGISATLFDSKLLLAVDGIKEEKKSVKANFGGEYQLIATAVLRAGLSAGKPTFGFGFSFPFGGKRLIIDMAVEQARNIGGWETIAGLSVEI